MATGTLHPKFPTGATALTTTSSMGRQTLQQALTGRAVPCTGLRFASGSFRFTPLLEGSSGITATQGDKLTFLGRSATTCLTRLDLKMGRPSGQNIKQTPRLTPLNPLGWGDTHVVLALYSAGV